jgi:hypothetical protein
MQQLYTSGRQVFVHVSLPKSTVCYAQRLAMHSLSHPALVTHPRNLQMRNILSLG